MSGITALANESPRVTPQWGNLVWATATALSLATVGGLVAVGGCGHPPFEAAGTTPSPIDRGHR